MYQRNDKYQKHLLTHDQLVEEYMDEDDHDFYTDSAFSDDLADQSHQAVLSFWRKIHFVLTFLIMEPHLFEALLFLQSMKWRMVM